MRGVISPLRWYGGKSQYVTWILGFMPPHTRYIEVFGGSAAVLFAKEPSAIEVYNDLDEGLVTFFRVLRDPALFPEFFRRVQLVPYSREEWRTFRATWNTVDDPIERAVRWYVVARWSFSGDWGQSWAYDLVESTKRASGNISRWLSVLDELPRFHQRLMRVSIEHDDWSSMLDRYDGTDTLFYLDPPYVPGTRSAGTYEVEMTEIGHEDLVDRLLTVQGMVIMSGYQSPTYAPLESAGWRRFNKDVPLRAKNGRHGSSERRMESLWLNPACVARQRQISLFD